jgi:hypothetical protein
MKKIALSLLLTSCISAVSFAADTAPAQASDIVTCEQILKITNVEFVVTGKNAALYFMAQPNISDKPIKIISVELTDPTLAEKSELHQTMHKDGVCSMTAVKEIVIPNNQIHEFKRGADHVMVINLKKPLINGDTVELVINFADGQKQHFSATVKVNQK